MNDKDLKIRALTERIGELTADYENKIADLRVMVTHLTMQQQSAGEEVIEGDIVGEETS